MHRNRIISSMLITLCLCCSIWGCASQTGSQPATASAGSGKKITIAASDGSHTDVINAVKGDFEKENNCLVEVIPLSADDIRKTAIEDIQNPEGKYDVIMIDDPLMPEYIEKNGVYKDKVRAPNAL